MLMQALVMMTLGGEPKFGLLSLWIPISSIVLPSDIRIVMKDTHFFFSYAPSLTFIIFLCTLFPCSPAGKESTSSEGDLGLIPGLGGSPGEGKSYPLQYSGLKNSIDCIARGGCKESDRTERLSHLINTNRTY